MFIILYRFKVKPNKIDDFKKGWRGLTELIYKHEGSLGSRLHKNNNDDFIAYAQWPSELIFEASGDNLPDVANDFREIMREACDEIEVLHKMIVVEDLLKNE